MIKRYIIGLLLSIAALTSIAVPLALQPNQPFRSEKCAQGCIILDPTDIQKLQEDVQKALQAAFEQGGRAGYQEGTKDALEAIKTNKGLQKEFCPREV